MRIIGLGHYAPKTVKYNDDFKEIVDTSDEWIKSRTGIEKRHLTSTEGTIDLAHLVALNAIKDAKINSNEIDLVICATITPDNFTPSTASSLLKILGINNAMAFDISAACSGFVYAMNTAKALLKANNLKYALVIGCEALSKLIDYTDRSTCVLFGDGAGAAIIENTEDKEYFYCDSKTDEENLLVAKALKSNGIFKDSILCDHHLKMDGKGVYVFALDAINNTINRLLELSGLDINDIDMFIPHQANERIVLSVCRHYDLDINKFYLNISEYGNTSAASIPIALSEAYHNKAIKKGQNIMLIGFGAGLTWAGMLFKL